jgi:hypothetical protein
LFDVLIDGRSELGVLDEALILIRIGGGGDNNVVGGWIAAAEEEEEEGKG